MKERRRYERFDLTLPARIEKMPSVPGEEKEVLTIQSKNICAGGAYFSTPKRFPEGDQVKIGLIIQSEKLKKLTGQQGYLSIKGRVVRGEAEGMAVQFNKVYKLASL